MPNFGIKINNLFYKKIVFLQNAFKLVNLSSFSGIISA